MSQLYLDRVSQLQARLGQDQAYLLVNPNDIYYFSGFITLVPEEREAFLLITRQSIHLFYASFSPLPPDLGHIQPHPGTDPQRLLSHLKSLQSQEQWQSLYLDEHKMSITEYKALQNLSECQLVPLDRQHIWSQRAIKDTYEIETIKQASQIAIQAFTTLLPQITTGMTEKNVQALLESLLRELGAQGPAFPTIVAFGPHGALPHYQPGDTVLQDETPILMDFGALFNHYRSDITRTWWHGSHPTSEFKTVHQTVQQAYKKAQSLPLHTPVSQVTAADLDTAARTHIETGGFGSQFIHTTGHGVGLDIHEPPSISTQNLTLLEPDMILTIEPGIYLEGKFGYRHENTILVTPAGFQELTVAT